MSKSRHQSPSAPASPARAPGAIGQPATAPAKRCHSGRRSTWPACAKLLAALTPQWRELYLCLPSDREASRQRLPKKLAMARSRISSLLVDLSRRGIEPGAATPDDINESLIRLATPGPMQSTQITPRLVWAWNTARAGIRQWPQFNVEDPNRPESVAPPISAFSPSLQIEFDNYRKTAGVKIALTLPAAATRLTRLRAQIRPFGSGRTFDPLSQASLYQHIYTLRRTAAVVAQKRGVSLPTIASIGEVATIEGAAALVDALLQGAEAKNDGCRGLVAILRSIAMRWRDDLSHEEYDSFGGLIDEITVSNPENMTPAIEKALARFTPDVLTALDSIAPDEMAALKRFRTDHPGRAVPIAKARRLRAVLGVLFERRACPKLCTLAGTHRDDNFRDNGDGTATLHYSRAETTTGAPIKVTLTREETDWVDLYFDTCVPVLATPGSRYLFGAPTSNKPMIPSLLARQICRLVAERTGVKITMPLFRAIKARDLLASDPEKNLPLARKLLGLAVDSPVADKFIGADSSWASGKVEEAIEHQITAIRQRRPGSVDPA